MAIQRDEFRRMEDLPLTFLYCLAQLYFHSMNLLMGIIQAFGRNTFFKKIF